MLTSITESVEINIRHDTKALTRSLSLLEKRNLPRAIVQGLNDTADDVRHGLYANMKSVFYKPVALTVPKDITKANNKRGSLIIWYTTKSRKLAKVFLKDFSASGTAPIKYHEPQIKGRKEILKGQRGHSRREA